jgi:hypothetical protein
VTVTRGLFLSCNRARLPDAIDALINYFTYFLDRSSSTQRRDK